jgi:hypothetical protein
MIVYEGGVKRHVKRLKAPTRMVAPDVVPDRLYLAQLGFGPWTLVKVQCAKEPGWLRGYVNVRGFRTCASSFWRAYVTVEPINGDRHVDMLVMRRRFEEPWTFADEQQGTLMTPPSDYLDNQINILLAKQAEHQRHYLETLAEVRRLESLK